jgi:diguanylate cyclase (GGDEF)-like protein/PAS domain S-box-containing protein
MSDDPIPDPNALTAFADAPLGIAVTTPDGVLVEVNQALCGLLGRRPTELRERELFDFTHPEDLVGARQACAALLRSPGRVGRHECRLVDSTGRTVPVQVVTSRVDRTDARASHLVMVIEDIAERKAAEERLMHRAVHDPLTGLPNRRLFDDRLNHALERGHRDGTPTCVVVVDLDDFKAVNDRWGHLAGDELLTAFATRLDGVLRASDTAARLGGDEFAVVCEDTGEEEAKALVRRLREALAEPLPLDGRRMRVGFSVGIGSAPGGADPEEAQNQIIRDADRRMYREKAAHRQD